MEEVNIVIIRTMKTKKGGSGLFVGIREDKPSDYSKGLEILDSWYDDQRAFNIDEKYFLKPLKGVIGYKRGFNGSARQYIEKIYGEDGTSIMA